MENMEDLTFKIRWNEYVRELLSGRIICPDSFVKILISLSYSKLIINDRPLGILPLLGNFWNSLVNHGIYTRDQVLVKRASNSNS